MSNVSLEEIQTLLFLLAPFAPHMTEELWQQVNGQWTMDNGQLSSQFSIVNFQLNREELGILRWLYRFEEVVMSAGAAYEPSQICTYLYELAQKFNTFYNQHTILGEEKTKELRLGLTAAVGQVVKNGLWLLGIKSPEKM